MSVLSLVMEPGPDPRNPPNNVYLVGPPPWVLVDCGLDSGLNRERILGALEGASLAAIALTHLHGDHGGNARALAAATGARLLARPAEAAVNPELCGATTPLRDDDLDLVRVGLRPLATPGHTPGHVCFLREGDLFGGDLVLPPPGTTWVGPPHGDMGAYLASLEMVMELDSDRILPGHGGPITAPGERIRDLLAHRRAREAQVLAALEPGGSEAGEVSDRIYAGVAYAIPELARLTVEGHLLHLEERGLAWRQGERWLRVSPPPPG